MEKNLVEKLCKVLEMEPKIYTLGDPKLVFEKMKFKVLYYIQLDFICQRPELSKDQIAISTALLFIISSLKIFAHFIYRNHLSEKFTSCN